MTMELFGKGIRQWHQLQSATLHADMGKCKHLHFIAALYKFAITCTITQAWHLQKVAINKELNYVLRYIIWATK